MKDKKEKWEIEQEKKAKIKPKEVKDDLKVLGELALRSANSYQIPFLYDAFGRITSDARMRNMLNYIINREVKTRADSEVEPRELLKQLEKLAVVKKEKWRKDNRPENGWWGCLNNFLAGLSNAGEILHGGQNELSMKMLKAAYSNEGTGVDFDGVARLAKIIEDSNNRVGVNMVLRGKKPRVPYCSKGLPNYILSEIKNGWGSRICGYSADLVKILLDFKAPEELLKTAHQVIERQKTPGYSGWNPRVTDIARYISAGEDEKEYIRAFLKSDILWTYAGLGRLEERIHDHRIFRFLTSQIRRDMDSNQLSNLGTILSVLEENPEVARTVGKIFGSSSLKLEDVLDRLGDYDVEFLGAESMGSWGYGGARTPLPGLVRIAQQNPPKRVVEYFKQALESDAGAGDISYLADRFHNEFMDKVNSGKRAHYSSCCTGESFRKNKEKHMPISPKLSGESVIERGAAALKLMYDEQSKMDHEVVIGKLQTDEKKCYTAAFVNKDSGVVHAVFTNSMMFDPAVSEGDCKTCNSLPICRGMEEYAGAVLFNPREFDREFLLELQKTIPGSFELHRTERGLAKYGNFAMFPDRMALVYYNPLLTNSLTPINTERSYQNMVVFPFNMRGSAYLAHSLRTKNITLPKNTQVYTERVVIKPEDWSKGEKLEEVRRNLEQFTGREVRAQEGREGSVVYHSSIDEYDLNMKTIGYSQPRKNVTITPVYRREIISRRGSI